MMLNRDVPGVHTVVFTGAMDISAPGRVARTSVKVLLETVPPPVMLYGCIVLNTDPPPLETITKL